MSDKKKTTEVPDHVIESFARSLLPAIRKYFDSEEGQKGFALWKAEAENSEKQSGKKVR